MTAAVATQTLGVLGAPRRARVRAALGLGYVAITAGYTLARSARWENIVRAGEAAAALAVMGCVLCLAIALLVVIVRGARLSIDAHGVAWGFRGLSFRIPAARIRVARLYRDAVAVVPRRGFVWYLSASDYVPFAQVVAGFRRAGLPLSEEAGRAPLRARLQAYGPALDVLLVLDVLAATALFLLA